MFDYVPDARLWATMIGLLLFGVAYNFLADAVFESSDGKNPWTAFEVVGGVAFTLLAVRWLLTGISVPADVPATEIIDLVFVAFAASGAPMIVGDAIRYLRNR